MRESDRDGSGVSRGRSFLDGSPEASHPAAPASTGEPADDSVDQPAAFVPPAGGSGRVILLLVLAFAVHRIVVWALDARPAALGEPLALRWLRALADHPVRGPLGLVLALLAIRALYRAIGGSAPRA